MLISTLMALFTMQNIYSFSSKVESNCFTPIAGNWDWEKRGVLVASQKVEYRHPVKLNDVLEINTWVKSVGEKSLTIAYEAFIVEGDSSILSAESETVIVCFDPVSKKTVKVPNLWRSAIEDHNFLAKS